MILLDIVNNNNGCMLQMIIVLYIFDSFHIAQFGH